MGLVIYSSYQNFSVLTCDCQHKLIHQRSEFSAFPKEPFCPAFLLVTANIIRQGQNYQHTCFTRASVCVCVLRNHNIKQMLESDESSSITNIHTSALSVVMAPTQTIISLCSEIKVPDKEGSTLTHTDKNALSHKKLFQSALCYHLNIWSLKHLVKCIMVPLQSRHCWRQHELLLFSNFFLHSEVGTELFLAIKVPEKTPQNILRHTTVVLRY